ncbi:polysaccharide deacetylase family protein [Pseudomonadota bacterium]
MSKGRLNILIYHRVLNQPDPLRPNEVDIQRFNKHMKWVKRCFNVLDLSKAVELMHMHQLPPRSLSITFDDGYKDNYTNALPILKAHQLKATVFVSTAFLNSGAMWNDIVIESFRNVESDVIDMTQYGLGVYDLIDERNGSLNRLLTDLKYLSFDQRAKIVGDIPGLFSTKTPLDLMMNDDEVKAMSSQGITIGAHTVNHPILSKIEPNSAEHEILGSKNYLEELLDKPVDMFAYPNGKPGIDYCDEHVQMVKRMGFKAAVSTAWGVASDMSDRYQLPRFTPWDRNALKYIGRLWMMRCRGAL